MTVSDTDTRSENCHASPRHVDTASQDGTQFVGVATRVKERMQKVASPNGVQLQPMLLFPEVPCPADCLSANLHGKNAPCHK